jgi:hypothetical protein
MIDFAKLAEKFGPEDIEWRLASSGEGKNGPWAKCFAYITNRAIQKRLDEVCGPGNWYCEYKEIDGGFLCGISILVDRDRDGWITKWDGADRTDVEPIKGGLSGAMKRAAVHWQIGRYLYDLEETWAECSWERQDGWNYGQTKDRKGFYWKTPDLPEWALPGGSNPGPQRGPATVGQIQAQVRQAQRELPGESEPPRPAQQAPPRQQGGFKQQQCPNCGLSDTVFKSKKPGEGFYCWRKKESKAMPGQYGCGHQWGGEGEEEPFSGTKVDIASFPRDRTSNKPDTVDPVFRNAEFIMAALDDVRKEAYRNTILKRLANRDITLDHVFEYLKCAFQNCTQDQLEHVEVQAKALAEAASFPPELWDKLSQELPIAEDRLSTVPF